MYEQRVQYLQKHTSPQLPDINATVAGTDCGQGDFMWSLSSVVRYVYQFSHRACLLHYLGYIEVAGEF